IPMLLKKYNISDMQAKGFKLTAEDVYSINQASLKDAIVIFGGGCTGELISPDGLLITNHHCGYGAIQRHSTVENDYLTNGFWAMSRDEELPNAGLRVTFLVRMEDVTDDVLKGVTDEMTEGDRSKILGQNMNQIRNEAINGTHYTARVASFFSGNQYFMFIYEDYRDVRLVGAPPSAIGKFGGETDNWMWPRHTGDFSLFRIYANKDNQPADYSPDNVPYSPKKFLPISVEGVDKGDFTMVFGYPGRTSEYAPASRIQDQISNTIPVMIDLRTKRLNIILAAMEISPKIRIQYSAKKSGIANSWKKNQGILRGLKRLDAVNKKLAFEEDFTNWVNQDSKRKLKYGHILNTYASITEAQSPFAVASTYANEAGRAPEIISLAGRYKSLLTLLESKADKDAIQKTVDGLLRTAERHFKDYHGPTDQKILAAMYEAWANGADPEFQPDLLREVKLKYKGDFKAYAADVFDSSIFASKEKLTKFLTRVKGSSAMKLSRDPAYKMSQGLSSLIRDKITPGLATGRGQLPVLDRLYMAAQMEMDKDKLFYPDANFTLRISYGKVDDFIPRDGIKYKHYSTLKGIVEKDNPNIYDYRVPQKLKDLYKKSDFGIYGKNGEMPVCFIASNHTSGGNSGSPVINADGHLIGINFDRNWEGTMSDTMYDPEMCRNISIDIRYALFIIDKFAGAGHLIKEMQLMGAE
ncbi:MAG: S46 family peptidase, partial [Bacteroidetes bacterium]|nr:S46 family peptidase [Bacteroidota bacterium]